MTVPVFVCVWILRGFMCALFLHVVFYATVGLGFELLRLARHFSK